MRPRTRRQILAIAGSRESIGEGVSLLAVCSAGLGVPFLVTTLALDKFFIASKRIRSTTRRPRCSPARCSFSSAC